MTIFFSDCLDIDIHSLLSPCSMKRIEAYCNHLVDYHLIMDLMPVIAKYYFFGYFQDYFLSSIQEVRTITFGIINSIK